MNLQQLPYLTAIAQKGSLSGAAQALGITQPALSRYLHDLEHDAGLELFYRERKKMFPTAAGKVYLETVQEMQDVWDNTRRSIALLDCKPQERLRIGLSPHRGSTLLADIYPYFNREYPQVELTMLDGYFQEEKDRLLRGEVDLVMSGGPLFDDVWSIPFTREEIVLAVPAFHRPEVPQVKDFSQFPFARLEEFKDAVFVMPQGGASLTQAVEPLFQRAGFQPQVAFSTPNVVTESRLIASGMGVGLLPTYYAVNGRDMVYYRLEDPAFLTSHVFFRQGYQPSKAERFFIFLMARHIYKEWRSIDPNAFRWSDFTRQLVEEYDPTWAQELRREDPDYGQ